MTRPITSPTELSYTRGAGDAPLAGLTIGEDLERTATRFPQHEALVSCHQGLRYTYAELNVAVDRLASGLLKEGIEKGDRVGIWAPNCSEWVLVQYAAAKIGAILVNINPAYRTSELAYVMRQSGVRLLVHAPSFRASDYTAMIDDVRSELPRLDRTVRLGSDGWNSLSGAIVDRRALENRSASLAFDDAINIQYTSGTTGFPKGATLSHHNILNNGSIVADQLGYTETDRVCLPVPFYHCFGMVLGNLACTTHGSCIVIPSHAFDAVSTLEAVARESCTSLYGVPTMFMAMLSHGFSRGDLTSLRTGIMAGAPCPVELIARIIDEMGISEMSICYGMTETSPVSTQTRRDDARALRVGTVGRASPHVEIKVVDPRTGLAVRRGEPGELCVRGYSVMLGYWDDPRRTAEIVDRSRWLHTGDLATMNPDGYLNIVGRIKDVVIRGGENIYPREIEEFLEGHPDIVDVQVVGVPDELYGEQICAWLRTRPGTTIDAIDVRLYCKGRLAHYKIPHYVFVRDEFPLTVTGKVQKFRLRELAIERLGLERVAATQMA